MSAGGRRFFLTVNAIPEPFGSMVERTLADLRYSLSVPDGVSDAKAAALGNAGLAAWLPLSWRARLIPGERVLVLGATGTTGKIAVAAAALLGAGGDYLNGPVAETALQVVATCARFVQVGSIAGPGTLLPAQLARRTALDLLGFAYYHAPIDEQAAAYAGLCEAVVMGKIKVDCTRLPLVDFISA